MCPQPASSIDCSKIAEESKDTTPEEESEVGDDGVDQDNLVELAIFETETNSGAKKKLHDLVSTDVWKKGLEVMAKKKYFTN